jgi:DNA-binding MarR family transcriptional regulator
VNESTSTATPARRSLQRDASGLTRAERETLIAIQSQGEDAPSSAQLARLTKQNSGAIHTRVQRLVEAGFLAIGPAGSAGGFKKSRALLLTDAARKMLPAVTARPKAIPVSSRVRDADGITAGERRLMNAIIAHSAKGTLVTGALLSSELGLNTGSSFTQLRQLQDLGLVVVGPLTPDQTGKKKRAVTLTDAGRALMAGAPIAAPAPKAEKPKPAPKPKAEKPAPAPVAARVEAPKPAPTTETLVPVSDRERQQLLKLANPHCSLGCGGFGTIIAKKTFEVFACACTRRAA